MKHSGAAAVHLTVTAVDGEVTADVADDGHGIEVTVRRSGLENLRVRRATGGSFHLDTGPRGTRRDGHPGSSLDDAGWYSSSTLQIVLAGRRNSAERSEVSR